ncbi:MAG: alternative ribosome rescue aminoacyl-tRNA hydrolase ArfB [Pseudomonadota bacterium]|nr:alternative ribosome rescue aminoacyl-tRNA hydrolase ArfB [Pseudomonadota bacterium]
MNTYKLPTHLCDFRFVLASGPGGQHVNKTATAVELRIPLTKLGLPPAVLKRLSDQQGRRINKAQQLIVQASSYRSQLTNKEDAIARAEKLISAAWHAPKTRHATKPTAAAKRRRLDKKKKRGHIKNHRQRPSLDG